MSNNRLLQVIERFATVGSDAVASPVADQSNPDESIKPVSNRLPQMPQLPQPETVLPQSDAATAATREPVVMHWDIHAVGLATGALVLCEDCREFTLGAAPLGDGQFADGNCRVNGPVFARCPFDCREYHARNRPWS
jgi:hypothetical protein